MQKTIPVARVGLTIELLLHIEYGVRGRELLNETLALNPGIAGLGPLLPLGARVVIPDLPAKRTDSAPVITLFG